MKGTHFLPRPEGAVSSVKENEYLCEGGGLGMGKTKGLNIREPANNCCCCIPIKTGMAGIMACVLLQVAIAAWVTALYFISIVKIIFGVIYGIINLPLFLSGYYFWSWWKNDSIENRARLP